MLGITTALLAGAALSLGGEATPIAAPAPEPLAAAPDEEIPSSRAGPPPHLEPPPEPREGMEGAAADAQRVISSVVKKSQGPIQSCLEKALINQPTLNGRVSIGWSIVAGRVTQASVVSNDTGDDALAACMSGAVRTFRFPETLTAEVAEFPWVLSGG